MLARLLIAAAIVAALLWLLRWFVRTPPRQVAATLRRVGLWGGIGLVFVLAATGKLNWMLALAAAAVPVVQRLLVLLQLVPHLRRLMGMLKGTQAAGGAAGPRTSRVTTRFLQMELDHESGALGGTVREGAFAGRSLAEMSLAELLELVRTCRTLDPQSAAVLEAYLDRTREPDWRSAAGEGADGQAGASAPAGKMTRAEAYRVLGLEPGASPDDIRAAHRRLMQKMHPDRGGSTFLAALINQAKDLLLAESTGTGRG